jgi:hypothetical protein
MLDDERTLVKLKRRIILVVRARQRIIVADDPCNNRYRFRTGFLLVRRNHCGDTLSLRYWERLGLYGEWFWRRGWGWGKDCSV